jgi:putative salt-induced outer membrane protein YdiY
MNRSLLRSANFAAPLMAFFVFSSFLAAQDAPKLGWSDKASLSYVAVGGNAQSQSLGFSNEYKYLWTNSGFAFNFGGVRVNTTTVNRTASGTTLSNAVLVETFTSTTSSENYFANTRFDRKISQNFFWFAGAGWERNRPAGMDNRYNGLSGAGYWWVNEDRTKLRTDLGVGYTKENLVFQQPGYSDSYGTWNLETKLEKKIFNTSSFMSDLLLTNNLKDSQDYLAIWRNAFTTNLNGNLALKIGYDITYKNKPAFVGVDVIQTPIATPPVVLGKMPVQLKKTDTVFTTSLVITF